MGLFSGIGKVFGGVLKAAGSVASVAGAIAPIPGLGFAGKIAKGAGGFLTAGKRVQRYAAPVLRTASGAGLKPGVLASISPVMPGGAIAPGASATRTLTGYGAGFGGIGTAVAAIAAKGQPKKKRRKAAPKRRRARRRRGGLTAAQLRAGFGGKRRMRRR